MEWFLYTIIIYGQLSLISKFRVRYVGSAARAVWKTGELQLELRRQQLRLRCRWQHSLPYPIRCTWSELHAVHTRELATGTTRSIFQHIK